MHSRRAFLGLGLSAGVGLAFPAPDADVPPDERIPEDSPAKGMLTPAAEKAIQKGLSYLHARRHRDGAFGTGGYSGNVAVTGLAGLAFMYGGHEPGRGAYGKTVVEALRYVLRQENV